MRHDGLLRGTYHAFHVRVQKLEDFGLDGFTAFCTLVCPVLCLTRLLSDKVYVPDRTSCSAGCFSRLAFSIYHSL
jgi:hypothetical protein